MNKRVFILLAFGWILAGCTADINQSHCSTPVASPMPTCFYDNTGPKVTINLDTDPFTVDPECIIANNGEKIEFILKSTSTINWFSVNIDPKDQAHKKNDWLSGNNGIFRPKEIKIKVKEKSGGGLAPGYYEYAIRAKNGCLDPRVKVEN